MHRFANPARFLRLAKPLTPALFWPGLVLALGACIWGLFNTPTERLMGDTVKILRSKGAPPVDVPDVNGLTAEEATAALAAIYD